MLDLRRKGSKGNVGLGKVVCVRLLRMRMVVVLWVGFIRRFMTRLLFRTHEDGKDALQDCYKYDFMCFEEKKENMIKQRRGKR